MVKPIPDHLRTVTPRLAVDAIGFYARAFGAEQVGDVFPVLDVGDVRRTVSIIDSHGFVEAAVSRLKRTHAGEPLGLAEPGG